MSISFLPNGHVLVTALKKGTGDKFFTSSKWQKRYLDIDPDEGKLVYADKAGGAAKGDFLIRNAIVTLPPPSIEGTPRIAASLCFIVTHAQYILLRVCPRSAAHGGVGTPRFWRVAAAPDGKRA